MKVSSLFLIAFLFYMPVVFSQTIIMDNFETGLGRFGSHVGHSGTVGVIHTGPRLDLVTPAKDGRVSLLIPLIDNDTTSDNWFARVLSGEGQPSANIKLDSVGYIGYWLKTNNPYLETSIMVDSPSDPLGTERCDSLPVIGDGEWHLYEFNLGDPTIWHPWGGPSANGKIEKPTTLDCIVIQADNQYVDGDTVYVWLDVVMYNPLGPVADVAKADNNAPESYALLGNYPNPFNPSTTVSYTLKNESAVELKIYDVMGREVRSFDIGSQSAGKQEIMWDGKNMNGENVSSGIYLYKIKMRSLVNQQLFEQSAKMMLMK